MATADKANGKGKFLRKYASYSAPVLDEWLLDPPAKTVRGMLLECRYDTVSTVFCTQYAQKDWYERLGGDVHSDAIMDPIMHSTIWVKTGTSNIREYTAPTI